VEDGEVDERRAAAVAPAGGEWRAAAARILAAAWPSRAQHARLTAALQEAAAKVGGDDLPALAAALAALGIATTTRTAAHAARSPYTRLRHSFLVLAGAAGETVVLEPRFRERVAAPPAGAARSRAAEVLATLPDAFVGSEAELSALISLAAEALAAAYDAAGRELPPWRREAALRSSWLGEAAPPGGPASAAKFAAPASAAGGAAVGAAAEAVARLLPARVSGGAPRAVPAVAPARVVRGFDVAVPLLPPAEVTAAAAAAPLQRASSAAAAVAVKAVPLERAASAAAVMAAAAAMDALVLVGSLAASAASRAGSLERAASGVAPGAVADAASAAVTAGAPARLLPPSLPHPAVDGGLAVALALAPRSAAPLAVKPAPAGGPRDWRSLVNVRVVNRAAGTVVCV